jgi:hypothetical protein
VFNFQNAPYIVSDSCAAIVKTAYPYVCKTIDAAPLMIIGCGRSGNTLLRAMLMAGDDIAIPPESYVWGSVAKHFLLWRFLPWTQVCDKVIHKFVDYPEFSTWGLDATALYKRAYDIPEEQRCLYSIIEVIYKAYVQTIDCNIGRWGDKTPLNTLYLHHINHIVPNSKYVHLVRDPRAVAQSYVKAAQTNAQIQEKTITDAAQRWQASEKSVAAFRAQIKPEQYMQIKFEDLILETESTLRRTCDFLSLDYSDTMVSRAQAQALGDVEKHQHHAMTMKNIDPSKIDQWKTSLSEKQVALIEEMTKEYARAYGYFK